MFGPDMQTFASNSRWVRWLVVAALYVSVFGCATAPAPAPVAEPAAQPAPVEQAAPAQPVAPPQPVVSAVTPPPSVEIAPASGVGPAAGIPSVVVPTMPTQAHIALLLPLDSPYYAKAADAVRQGFLAAATVDQGLPVRVYSCKDESTEITALYRQALLDGAVAVAGPLTRSGVAALAANPNLTIPTLAMNLMDGERSDNLYFYGLPSETEARLASQRATAAGLLTATVVRTNTAYSKRIAQAFSDDWERAGGILDPEIVYTGDPTALRVLPDAPGNMVFLAAEPGQARLMRPYIDSSIPVYATSQVFSGNSRTLTNYDLADVLFYDMPWMIQPDHPAVMIYPRPNPPMLGDLERLYALGIDSYRLLHVLMQNMPANALPLDGVTGRITLHGHIFERKGVLAVMRQGQAIPVDPRLRP
jgi:hypothetical protein